MAQVRTRKRGKTWSYIFEAGIVDGKRKVIEKGGYPTKEAAYKAGVERYTDHIHGDIGVTSESITLADFMTSWLENVVALNVKPSTMQTYQSMFKRHIVPPLGNIKVQDLTPALLDKWIRSLQKDGLAYNTISAAHILIYQALKYAVYPSQLISSNPADYIKVPRNAPRNVVKRTIITPECFAELLIKYPFGTPMHIPLLLLYHTGMRISEVLGLTWQDIDFVNKRINLWRQIYYLPKKGYYFTTLKTKSSKRYILIDDYLIGELKRWQEQQRMNEEQIGDSYVYIYCDEDGHIRRQSKCMPLDGEKISLVCVQSNGQLISRVYVDKTLMHDRLNAHSFRHTHATQLIELGGSAKAVAGRLGHTNVQITQNLYTHNTLKLQQELALIFAENLQTNH